MLQEGVWPVTPPTDHCPTHFKTCSRHQPRRRKAAKFLPASFLPNINEAIRKTFGSQRQMARTPFQSSKATVGAKAQAAGRPLQTSSTCSTLGHRRVPVRNGQATAGTFKRNGKILMAGQLRVWQSRVCHPRIGQQRSGKARIWQTRAGHQEQPKYAGKQQKGQRTAVIATFTKRQLTMPRDIYSLRFRFMVSIVGKRWRLTRSGTHTKRKS